MTPDGYDICPSCEHHTSAFCGRCTVIIPVLDGEGNVLSADYCGCDCYKALHGISLAEKIFGEKRGPT